MRTTSWKIRNASRCHIVSHYVREERRREERDGGGNDSCGARFAIDEEEVKDEAEEERSRCGDYEDEERDTDEETRSTLCL